MYISLAYGLDEFVNIFLDVVLSPLHFFKERSDTFGKNVVDYKLSNLVCIFDMNCS